MFLHLHIHVHVPVECVLLRTNCSEEACSIRFHSVDDHSTTLLQCLLKLTLQLHHTQSTTILIVWYITYTTNSVHFNTLLWVYRNIQHAMKWCTCMYTALGLFWLFAIPHEYVPCTLYGHRLGSVFDVHKLYAHFLWYISITGKAFILHKPPYAI